MRFSERWKNNGFRESTFQKTLVLQGILELACRECMAKQWFLCACKRKTSILLRASANQDLETSTLLCKSGDAILGMMKKQWFSRIDVSENHWFCKECLLETTKKQWFSWISVSETIVFSIDIGTRMSRMHDKTMVFVRVQNKNINFVKGFWKNKCGNNNII